MSDIIEALRGGLIVSCQAYPGEPMLHPQTMTQVAQSVVRGGAVGVRLKGLDDLRLARSVLHVPIIGLVKVGNVSFAGVGLCAILAIVLNLVLPDEKVVR